MGEHTAERERREIERNPGELFGGCKAPRMERQARESVFLNPGSAPDRRQVIGSLSEPQLLHLPKESNNIDSYFIIRTRMVWSREKRLGSVRTLHTQELFSHGTTRAEVVPLA